jgi:hypothetical protein
MRLNICSTPPVSRQAGNSALNSLGFKTHQLSDFYRASNAREIEKAPHLDSILKESLSNIAVGYG